MPTTLLDRIPLPSLKIYTSISVLLVSACIYYAINVTSDPFWRTQNNTTIQINNINNNNLNTNNNNNNDNSNEIIQRLNNNKIIEISDKNDIDNIIYHYSYHHHKIEKTKNVNSDVSNKNNNNNNNNNNLDDDDDDEYLTDTRSIGGQFKDVVAFMSQEPVCIWTLINMAYCLLILLGKSIQKVVFGELRISEQQHMKDKFWNFIFYKFIFVFGVVNVQFLHEVVLWVSWFSVLGFLHLLSQLCKDRFEYLSFSPTTPGWSHFRLVALLSSILTISGIMFIICIGVGLVSGMNTFFFMAAECILLSIRTLHVLIRYGMFLYDMRNGGISNEVVSWVSSIMGPIAYYIELVFEVAALIIDLLHHVHMLLWSNIFLSMASLVIVMQLRYLSHEIQRKIKKHRNYLWVLNHMEKSYPLATTDDLNQNSDNCAICWEKMETARKLPCSHLFHNSCLQSWLEQDTSCPTCRLGLSVQTNTNLLHSAERIIEDDNGRANNHFFHFNGSRYVSWLPNFSVEVTHINNVLRNDTFLQATGHTSQLRTMGRQVQQMFPRFPLNVIITDLQVTRSMEVTIDNILEGRLQIPTRHQEFNDFDDDFIEHQNDDNNRNDDSNNNGGGGGSDGIFNTPSDYYVNPEIQIYTDMSNDDGGVGVINRINNGDDSTVENGYEIERSSNIFGNQNDLLKDDSFEETALGDRFSKSSVEREKILQRRKEMLLTMARRRFNCRYLEKNKSDLNLPRNNKTSLSNDKIDVIDDQQNHNQQHHNQQQQHHEHQQHHHHHHHHNLD